MVLNVIIICKLFLALQISIWSVIVYLYLNVFPRRTNFFQLQNDLLQFVQRQGRLVVDSALSCLAVLVNQVLKDQTQVICCFTQFYGMYFT